MLLNLRPHILFDGDGGGSSGGGSPDTDANPGGQQGGGDKLPKSQEELDRLIGERAKRAETSAINALLQKLGLSKVEELETVVTTQRQAAEKEKTELQKAQEAARRAEKERDDLRAQWERDRVDRVIEREARTLGFAETALEDAAILVDRSLITADGDKISGVKEALEALLKAKPHLKGQAAPAAPDLDANKGKGSAPTQKSKEEREAELKRRYRI